ncbi:GNAT family N-acetyltransferase [Saccharopolyspora rhizosphaerae]|uniref:GNAT family N-acetyltransferase n=1 Tax=Saccharopolyspora rhizosphaerae TaxID=2492662 RepID=A0A426JYH5_9PSEU|nr:GNAT family N-acetyltransferase [Saccharopolyspora rhizosphaerae]RRO18213.1 GNAT family N-acetyltransferase [Saccharopolyspora rhizosphaerae]
MSACETSELERAAVATWPATTVVRQDGWLLRHCDRLRRRRSNSALPLGSSADPDAAIEVVERFYAERSSPPAVQVSPWEEHSELDSLLAERGYRADAPTVIMRTDREALLHSCPPQDFEVLLDPSPGSRWLDAVAAVGGRPEPGLDRAPAPVAFATAVHAENPVGVGMFAVSDDWCGLYGMHTAPEWRRRGVAASLIRAGVGWASAERVFLQVETANAVARSRYESLGFTRAHTYHYRIQ